MGGGYIHPGKIKDSKKNGNLTNVWCLFFLIFSDGVYSFVGQNPNSQEPVTVSVKLTNELPRDSPTCYQLYNILLRDAMKMMGMKEVYMV